MILNLYGPSGSGKTTFIKKLLKTEKLGFFYKSVMKDAVFIKNNDVKVSISLIPVPLFRGKIIDFCDCYEINFNSFFNQENIELFNSIFSFNVKDKFEKIKNRNLETLSAGEMRRFFILKSLIIKSDILVIDEPFSNSDKLLFKIIFKAIQKHSNCIILSHMPISDVVKLDTKDKTLGIEVATKILT